MNKFLILGVVAILIVAAVGIFLWDRGDDSNQITCTVYVQEVGSDEVLAAVVDLSEMSFAEQATMAIGGDIRTVQFAPMAYGSTIASVVQSGKYKIWSKVVVKVTASTAVKTPTTLTCKFSGFAGNNQVSGAPNHGNDAVSNPSVLTGYDPMYTAGSVQYPTTGWATYVFGTEYTLSQGSTSDPTNMFTQYAPNLSGTKTPILGDNVDGAVVAVDVTAAGKDASGTGVTSTLSAQLQISVTAWSSYMNISIISFSGGV